MPVVHESVVEEWSHLREENARLRVDLREAEASIEAVQESLKCENERLRAALEPFAKLAKATKTRTGTIYGIHGGVGGSAEIRFEDIHRAAAVLKQ